MRNRDKTMLCVALAGLIFIPSVIWNVRWPILIGAFFDWLPLPTGWMKFEGEKGPSAGKWVAVHVVLTLAAYLFAILWFFRLWDTVLARFLFLEIWWLAVMAGVKLIMSHNRG